MTIGHRSQKKAPKLKSRRLTGSMQRHRLKARTSGPSGRNGASGRLKLNLVSNCRGPAAWSRILRRPGERGKTVGLAQVIGGFGVSGGRQLQQAIWYDM